MVKHIGIVDSGLGGLAVAEKIWKLLPHESTIYLADHQYFPYGNKTTKQINQRLIKIVDFLVSKNTKLVVIACNTITVSSIDFLRSFFNILFIGTVPAIKPAIKKNLKENIVVLATKKTASSQYLAQLINQFDHQGQVKTHACPGLVEKIENLASQPQPLKKILKSHLEKINVKYSALVLGCTHYILVKNLIKQLVGSHIKIIEPSQAIAKQTEAILSKNHLFGKESKSSPLFLTTGNFTKATQSASALLGKRIIFKSCKI